MFHPEYIDPKKLITNDDILKLFQLVEKHGGVLRFVGGAVRDAIAGFSNSNIDLVTDLSPSEFSDMCDDEGLRCVPIGIQFFTIGVIVNSSFFKITSLSPEEDNLKDEWKHDASLRDLTINAVYADEKGNVFDYYNGIKDLENGVIKFIGKPEETIKNDYLRIMRFFRFCAMFGKKIDTKSLKACVKNRDLLKHVSAEKIKDELFKIILAPYAVRALELIFDNKIIDFLLAKPKSLDAISSLIKLESELNIEKNILRRIYAIFEPDKKRANRIADILKLSKDQKEHFISLASSKLSMDNFKDTVSTNKSVFKYGKDVCKDMVIYLNRENTNTVEVSKILNTVLSTNISPFPISGKDLIKAGVDTKVLGLYIDVLKKEWFDSGCLLSKNDLLEKYLKELKK
jgi:poly(A) polymerase